MISATGDPAAKDAALIAAAQRVEHYEIAGYGTADARGRARLHDAKDFSTTRSTRRRMPTSS